MGQEVRGRRGGEWTGEMTSGRIRTRVLHGRRARMWSGLLLAPQCPPLLVSDLEVRERRGGEWTGEMTSGRIRTRVLHGRRARMWSGLLLAPQCPPLLVLRAVSVQPGITKLQYLLIITIVSLKAVFVQAGITELLHLLIINYYY